MKKTAFLTLLISCSLWLLVACSSDTIMVAELQKPAPDFSLVDRQGKIWKLSDLKGQVVFLNFWATWCPPCVEEMPSMQKLNEMLPNDKFKMLSILYNDNPVLADSFATRFGITFPILNDQENLIAPKYGITGVPETFIINKQGVLVEKFIGPARWDSPGYVQMLMTYINQ